VKHTALAILLLLVASACGESRSASTTVRRGAPAVTATTEGHPTMIVDVDEPKVVVREGDVIRVPWSLLDVAILEIADSRCPSVFGGDEVCVWEGEVRTTIEFRSDDGVVERRVLSGLNTGAGQTAYGDGHWTWFDLVEVAVQDLDAEGNLTLLLSSRD
jgi:hypothetical protein